MGKNAWERVPGGILQSFWQNATQKRLESPKYFYETVGKLKLPADGGQLSAGSFSSVCRDPMRSS
jgi:hypothetical protein